jgi:hypothetical protein
MSDKSTKTFLLILNLNLQNFIVSSADAMTMNESQYDSTRMFMEINVVISD